MRSAWSECGDDATREVLKRLPEALRAGMIKDGANLRGYGFFLLGKRPVVFGQTVSNTEQLSGQVVPEKFS